jgi:hypothetical protein
MLQTHWEMQCGSWCGAQGSQTYHPPHQRHELQQQQLLLCRVRALAARLLWCPGMLLARHCHFASSQTAAASSRLARVLLLHPLLLPLLTQCPLALPLQLRVHLCSGHVRCAWAEMRGPLLLGAPLRGTACQVLDGCAGCHPGALGAQLRGLLLAAVLWQ